MPALHRGRCVRVDDLQRRKPDRALVQRARYVRQCDDVLLALRLRRHAVQGLVRDGQRLHHELFLPNERFYVPTRSGRGRAVRVGRAVHDELVRRRFLLRYRVRRGVLGV